MKKMSKKIRIIIFIVLIAVPYVARGLFGEFYHSGIDEKRELASAPRLSLQTIDEYPSDADAYINDHLPYRDFMLTGYSHILTDIFDTSPNDNVLIGKDDWYYLSDVNDGDPIGSFRGLTPLTDEELSAITDNLLSLRDSLEKEGRRFVLYLAPIKPRIYPEYLPDNVGTESAVYETTQLIDALHEADPDFPVVYSRQSLEMSKQERPDVPTYYKYDSHWTPYGAYVGSYDLLTYLGKEPVSPFSDALEFTEDYVHDDGDLLFLIHQYKEEKMKLVRMDGMGGESHLAENEDIPGMMFRTSDAGDEKLLVFQDSYYNYMARICSVFYGEAYSVAHDNCNPAFIEEYDPDVVVFEIAERNLRNLLNL